MYNKNKKLMKSFMKLFISICFVFAFQSVYADEVNQSNKTKNSGNSVDNFLNTKIPSGNKSKGSKPANGNSKVKKYPSYNEIVNNPDKYSDFGNRSVVDGTYLLFDNGTKSYLTTQEMVYTDGTIRKKDGKIYKVDGTQVNEYGVAIKGAKKVKPVIDAEKDSRNESVDDFLNTKIP